jgi:hypothetical protein
MIIFLWVKNFYSLIFFCVCFFYCFDDFAKEKKYYSFKNVTTIGIQTGEEEIVCIEIFF